ncbi:MAG: PIN domain-containing protein [Gammaproteobacteria bacterium]|nr:PIN domain-containing protein [Gammaproteobacteria bacterium]
MGKLLLDTCILIDYLRGIPAAVDFLEGLNANPIISAITTAELYSGYKGEDELLRLEQLLSQTLAIETGNEIAKMGGRLRKQYGPSHGAGLVDCLIAATALSEGAKVVTLNTKHFPMVETFRPY